MRVLRRSANALLVPLFIVAACGDTSKQSETTRRPDISPAVADTVAAPITEAVTDTVAITGPTQSADLVDLAD